MSLVGSVRAVASSDGILSIVADGYADLATQTPMRDDSLFWIASLSKPITATVVMMAVDDGALDLDAPVTDYLPDFRPPVVSIRDDGAVSSHEPATPITLRTLLNHTSGLPFASPVETPTYDLIPLATRVRAYALSPLVSPPGAAYLYSNAGYNVAARVLEVVTGSPFETVLTERLLEPLGMNDTTFWPAPAQIARLATAYRYSPDGPPEPQLISQLRYPLDDRVGRFPLAGGGLFSTAADVASFCRSFLGGRPLLSAAAIEQMTRPVDGYRLGWAVDAEGAFGHGGAYGTVMRIHPTLGRATVWMIQQAPSATPDPGGHAFEEFDRLVVTGTYPR